MSPEVRKALLSMGYRIHGADRNKWAKPLAHMVFTVELDRNEITLWFNSDSDTTKLLRWSTKEFLTEGCSPVESLVYSEADLIDNWRGGHTNFAFLTLEQEAEMMVDNDDWGV